MLIRTPSYLYMLNDTLGRLPVYTASSRGLTYFGRSLAWLHQHTKLTLDKKAVFEYLWCSYPLHFKTLYQDVYRYPGGSVTGINLQTQTITTYPGIVYNLPDHRKRYYRLYRHFMDGLSPKLNLLPMDSGTHIHHPKFVAGKMFHELLRATSTEIKSILKTLSGQRTLVTQEELTSRQVCLELIRQNPNLHSWIDTDHLKALLQKASNDQYAYIFTLAQLAKVL